VVSLGDASAFEQPLRDAMSGALGRLG